MGFCWLTVEKSNHLASWKAVNAGVFHHQQEAQIAVDEEENREFKRESRKLELELKRKILQLAEIDLMNKCSHFSKTQHSVREVTEYKHHKLVVVYDRDNLTEGCSNSFMFGDIGSVSTDSSDKTLTLSTSPTAPETGANLNNVPILVVENVALNVAQDNVHPPEQGESSVGIDFTNPKTAMCDSAPRLVVADEGTETWASDNTNTTQVSGIQNETLQINVTSTSLEDSAVAPKFFDDLKRLKDVFGKM
uniref:Clathrin light chain n=1 Tax=Globodera pallida TaxID=36090 RepID=A0A183BNN9_GLOPA